MHGENFGSYLIHMSEVLLNSSKSIKDAMHGGIITFMKIRDSKLEDEERTQKGYDHYATKDREMLAVCLGGPMAKMPV